MNFSNDFLNFEFLKLILNSNNYVIYTNNVSNNTLSINYEYDDNVKEIVFKIFLTILFVITFIVGIITNSLVIFVFLRKQEVRQYTIFFFVNLSFADILVLFICIPIAITDLFSPNEWFYGFYYCNILKFKKLLCDIGVFKRLAIWQYI